MALNIPVPKIVPDVGPGGPVFDVYNALTKAALDKRKRELENQYYGPEKESEIGQRQAVTEGQNILNQYAPNKYRLANEAAEQQNIFNKKMNPYKLQKEQILLENLPASEKARIESQKAMANWRNMGGSGMGVGQKDILSLQNQLLNENPNWTPQQANQAASAYISGENSFPDGTQLPPMSGIVESQVDQIIKRGTTTQALNQQKFAATTDAILEHGKKLVPVVSKYSGILGKGKGNLDAVKSGFGDNSTDYNDYVYFTRTFVPYAAGEMMRALGVNASDTQKELYQRVINPIAWDTNPKQAQENYNKMVKLFKETVSKTIAKSSAKIRSGLRGDNKTKNVREMSDEELRSIAGYKYE